MSLTPEQARQNGIRMNETLRKTRTPEQLLAWRQSIGHKGGSTPTEKLKGFAANPALAKKAGVFSGVQRRINKRRKARFGK